MESSEWRRAAVLREIVKGEYKSNPMLNDITKNIYRRGRRTKIEPYGRKELLANLENLEFRGEKSQGKDRTKGKHTAFPKLTERSIIDYLYNPKRGLTKVVRNDEGRFTVSITNFHDLVEAAEILTEDFREGKIIRRSIDTFFLKCFRSSIGGDSSLNSYVLEKYVEQRFQAYAKAKSKSVAPKSEYFRIGNLQDKVDHFLFVDLNNQKLRGLWPEDVISELISLASKIRGSLDLEKEFSYILLVMKTLFGISEDYRLRKIDDNVKNGIKNLDYYTVLSKKKMEDIASEARELEPRYYKAAFDLIVKPPIVENKWALEIYNDFKALHLPLEHLITMKNPKIYRDFLKAIMMDRTGLKKIVELQSLTSKLESSCAKLSPYIRPERNKRLLSEAIRQISSNTRLGRNVR